MHTFLKFHGYGGLPTFGGLSTLPPDSELAKSYVLVSIVARRIQWDHRHLVIATQVILFRRKDKVE